MNDMPFANSSLSLHPVYTLYEKRKTRPDADQTKRAATALLGRGGSAEKCRRLGERKDPREQGFDHRSPFRIRCESGGVVFKTLFAGILEVFCNTA